MRPGVFAGGVPKVPAGTPREVAAVFRRLCATLPQVSAADETLLLQLAEAAVLERRAFRLLAEEGLLTPDRAHGGEPRKHPALSVWRLASETARACLMRVGGSVLDRQRLTAPPADPQAELLELLFNPEAAHMAGAGE